MCMLKEEEEEEGSPPAHGPWHSSAPCGASQSVSPPGPRPDAASGAPLASARPPAGRGKSQRRARGRPGGRPSKDSSPAAPPHEGSFCWASSRLTYLEPDFRLHLLPLLGLDQLHLVALLKVDGLVPVAPAAWAVGERGWGGEGSRRRQCGMAALGAAPPLRQPLSRAPRSPRASGGSLLSLLPGCGLLLGRLPGSCADRVQLYGAGRARPGWEAPSVLWSPSQW